MLGKRLKRVSVSVSLKTTKESKFLPVKIVVEKIKWEKCFKETRLVGGETAKERKIS